LLKPAHKSRWIIALWVAIFAAANPAFAANRAAGVPATSKAEHDEPINVTGKQTIFDSDTDTFYVRGDAVMTQGGSVLKADEIDVTRHSRQARAIGHVHLIDEEVEIWATEGKIDLANETLELDNATILAKKNTYHLEGKKIVKLQGQNYEVTQGFFTTCGCSPGTPDWAINADAMDVDIGGVGTATNGKFAVLGQPIMSLPFAEFPADNSRHSGFLTGREGYSGLRGAQWLQPYYIVINKSSDATVAFDVETSERIGGIGEYRLTNGPDDYLWGDAAFYDESIRSDENRQEDIVDPYIADPHIPLDRYSLIAMARQHLTDNIIAYGDAMSVSDSLYLREMDVWTLSRGFGNNFGSMRNAASDFGFIDEFQNAYAQLQGQWNQDLIQPQEFALQRLPDLTVTGRQELFNGLMFSDYNAESVYFYRYQGVDGGRFSANPDITIPWHLGDYLTGYGTAGVSGTLWETYGHQLFVIPTGDESVPVTKHGVTVQDVLNPNNNVIGIGPKSQSDMYARAIPYLQAGISTALDRVYDVEGDSIEKLKNTIEPFVNYAYVPRIYQGNVALFDENDVIESRSMFTYGFTTRLFAKVNQPPADQPEITDETAATGGAPVEPAYGPQHGSADPGDTLAPRGATIKSATGYTQVLGDLTIQQAYDVSHEVALGGSNVSDVEGILNVYPTTVASLSSQLDYNPRSHAGITFANATLNVQPPWSTANPSNLFMGKALQGSFMQFGYSYSNPSNAVFQSTTNNGAQFITARAYTDLFDRMGIYFAPSYNIASRQLLSAEYGLRLKSPCDCWAADMGLVDSFNPNEVQFQFQLTLGGLGSLGRSPFGRNPFQTMGLVGSPTGVLPRY